MVTLTEKQRAADYLESQFDVSERRACKVITISRNSKRLRREQPINEIERLVIDLSENEPRWGYRKVHDRLRLNGQRIGRERVRLIRRREGLQVRKKQHRKRHPGNSGELIQAEYPNHVWTYDFVMDQTMDGRRLKALTIVDEFTRIGLDIVVSHSLTHIGVKSALQRLFSQHGRPAYIRSDNGGEFISTEIRKWLSRQGVAPHYIDPGSPWQNGYGESFNSIFRDDCLNRWIFRSPREARMVVSQWLKKYNGYRPHGSLDGITPNMFLGKWRQEHEDKNAA